jgi:hypothetical protein
MQYSRISSLFILSLLAACSDKGTDSGPSGDDTDSGVAPNSAPTAVDDSAETWGGKAVEVEVLDNDSDPEDDTLEITEVTQPENGFVEILTSGEDSVEYTPSDDFVGVDTFTYTMNDGNGGSDTGTVAVNVTDSPTLLITQPTDKEELTDSDVTVAFEVNGCNMSSPSSDADGCHLHKFLDGATWAEEDGTGHGHYDTGSFVMGSIEDGEHSISLQLISNDGSDAAYDPLIEDTVSFTVSLPDDGGKGDKGEKGDK